MSFTTKVHSSSTLSSSCSSASVQRQSYPAANRAEHTPHNRRNVHSAPAAFALQRPSKQASDRTLSFTSTDYASDDSTAVASSTASKDSPPSKSSLKSKTLSAEDELWANEINADLAAKDVAKANEEMAKAKAKAKRGCMGAIADEFDFGYANVPTRGSKGGRKSVGRTGVGRCGMM